VINLLTHRWKRPFLKAIESWGGRDETIAEPLFGDGTIWHHRFFTNLILTVHVQGILVLISDFFILTNLFILVY